MNSKHNTLLIGLITILFLSTYSLAAGAQNSVRQSGPRGKTTYQVNIDQGDFKIEYEGEIELSDDDKDIIRISRGGYFELSKSSFGASRRIKIESDRDGLHKQFFVGRSEQDWEPDGRKWLAEILPDLVRSTTIAAKSRVDRIYTQGGSDALVRELGLLKGDYVRNAYFKLAFGKQLSQTDQVKLLKIAGETVSSDHYLSEILTGYFDKFGLTGNTTDPFLAAADEIQSDHYKSGVLTKVAKSNQIQGQQLAKLIRGSAGINSDHYKSGVLIEILERNSLNDSQLSALLSEANDIQSDHYLSNVLIKLAETQNLSASGITRFLSTSENIQSDHYKHSVYTQLLKDKRDEQTLSELFSVAGTSINSDHYLSEVLKTGIRNQEFSGKAMDEFITAIGSIGSDHYASEVINAVSRKQLSEDVTIKLLNATTQINSDNYLSNSLIALSGKVNSMSDRVKSAYRSAAKEISSDTYYGRAMKALEH